MQTLSPEQIAEEIHAALSPMHFFVGQGLALEWEMAVLESGPWEVYQGRLLDRAHTRQVRTFAAWNVYALAGDCRSEEPLLSVKLDLAAAELHVTRGLECYVWEGYHAGDNVYLSREVRRWVRELAGSLRLANLNAEELRHEIGGLLFRAVVGSSRLPLTSVESPLPAFSLGQLAYFPLSGEQAIQNASPMTSWRALLLQVLQRDLSWLVKTRLLEVLLRSARGEEIAEATARFVRRWQEIGHTPGEVLVLLRTLFNEVALSPYTEFVEHALAFLQALAEDGWITVAQQADFLSHLLRQLGRHLTAYDLVTFHHRGANYPDTLLLDAALKAYLGLIERQPELLLARAGESEPELTSRRLRRRGLRQGWLLRRWYEGHPVPDAPTSEGENARVLPPPFVRVPSEQILQPSTRGKRLFADDPLPLHLGEQGRELLRQSVRDLHDPRELRELGLGVFLDRPLGVFKPPVQPDQTLLFSYEAFSRTVAQRRLDFLRKIELLSATEAEELRRFLEHGLQVKGIPVASLRRDRPALVSLEDARKAAEDFVLLRTTRQAVEAFRARYDLTHLEEGFPPEFLTSGRPVLIMSETPGVLTIYDGELRRRLELQINSEQGYEIRRGLESPVGGLRLLRSWAQE
jgi:hypothetical protein